MSTLTNIFDTETTGIPEYKLPSEDPCQPHLVELAANLYDDTGLLVESFSAIIKPDGWEIPEAVIAIHGITMEMAMDVGIPEKEAVEAFMALHAKAGLRVAHNCSFDDRIIRIALKRYLGDEAADLFKAGPNFCTALKSKSVLMLPATEAMTKKSNFKVKTPTLAEAYEFFTGQKLEESHRAKADAEACARVYFAMQKVAA